MNHNAVRLQLEGLFSNPGIDMDLIMVCKDLGILSCQNKIQTYFLTSKRSYLSIWLL